MSNLVIHMTNSFTEGLLLWITVAFGDMMVVVLITGLWVQYSY